MRLCLAPFRLLTTPYSMAVCALFLLAPGLLPANADGVEFWSAQDNAPSQQAAAPQPTPSIFPKPIPRDQLAFLAKFQGKTSGKAFGDKEYRKLLHSLIPDCVFHYGRDMSLYDAFDMVLSSSSEPVQIREGRYVMVSGKSGPYLSGRGFMWIDMQDGIALGGFYFRPTNGEPTPTVNLFSDQVRERALKMTQLPAAFAEDLSRWSEENRIPPITTRYFINGYYEKILLEHDEDYCAPADGTVAPRKDACLQMNADAADVDVTAAYYLEHTHHATNATAWMINGGDQGAWIQVRTSTCRLGPDPLGCYILMTRQRTQVILRRTPPTFPTH